MSEVSLSGAEGHGNLISFSATTKEILRHLDQKISAPPLECPGLGDLETLGRERLTDVRTRFLLWSGNLGVMRKPEDPRALDRRLLDAPEVASRVHDILKDLQDLLSQSGSPCDCDATNDSAAQEMQFMDEEDAMMMQLLGLKTSKGCTTSWLSASLDDTLRRLFHLSALISKSSTRDKFARAGLKCRLEMYEAYDVRHVREKVAHAGGRADVVLIERLGKANTNRRQFIAYSREHTAELNQTAQGEDCLLDQRLTENGHINACDRIPYGQSVGQSEKTKKSDAPTIASTLGPINPSEFDHGLDDARSCTTVATSIVDGKAFSGLDVPDFTQYAKPGVHFVCPFCRTYQRFNGQTAWRRHVFSDIRAYVCTSPKCGMLMFGSFNAWRSHEMDHRREWFCPLCSLLHRDMSKAKMHLMHHHGELAENHEMDMLLQTSSRPLENLPADDCPFCDWGMILRERNRTPKEHDLTVPSRRFMKHFGRHLEEIALFVIPQPEEEQRSPEDTDSNIVHAVQDEDSATVSTLSSFQSQPSFGASIPTREDLERQLAALASMRPSTGPDGASDELLSDGQDGLLPDTSAYGQPNTNVDSTDHGFATCPNGQAGGSTINNVNDSRQPSSALAEHDHLSKHSQEFPPGNPYHPYPAFAGSRRPSISLVHSRHSQTSSSDESGKGLCPYPTCGRHFKDLKAHMLTHQNTRTEKCPMLTCEYHTKGFVRRYDRNRHVLTHYKGTMTCGFCPGSGSAAEKSFNRVDVFKRHLTSVHGVEQTPPNARRRYKSLSRSIVRALAGTCSTCGVVFADAQKFYEHLDDCILRVVQWADSPEAHPKLPDTSVLHADFSSKAPGNFSAGRVFDVLWTEQGERDTLFTSVVRNHPSERPGKQSGCEIRRFAIASEGAYYCKALLISTYNGQGVAMPGVTKSEHAIIFTGQDVPAPSENELPEPGETPMRHAPIRVLPDDSSGGLDPMSRINLGEIHLLKHDIRAKRFGVVHEESMEDFMQQFLDACEVPRIATLDTGRHGTASGNVDDESKGKTQIDDGDGESQEGQNERDIQNDENVSHISTFGNESEGGI